MPRGSSFLRDKAKSNLDLFIIILLDVLLIILVNFLLYMGFILVYGWQLTDGDRAIVNIWKNITHWSATFLLFIYMVSDIIIALIKKYREIKRLIHKHNNHNEQ